MQTFSMLDQLDQVVQECTPADESVDRSRYFFKITKIEKKSFKVTGRQNIAWIQ